jgi:alpha-D-ribose 1-methylphosphonate 5-triphosphate synthase subunit PhnG
MDALSFGCRCIVIENAFAGKLGKVGRTAMQRREWMGVLGRATPDEVDAAWQGHGLSPAFVWLRAPAFCLVMVRGRVNGSGDPFNLGEMTVTRCALQLDTGCVEQGRVGQGCVGLGYVAGRHKRHAALAALFDALLQQGGTLAEQLLRTVAELDAKRRARHRHDAAMAATSQVDFTMQLSEVAAEYSMHGNSA